MNNSPTELRMHKLGMHRPGASGATSGVQMRPAAAAGDCNNSKSNDHSYMIGIIWNFHL